MLATPLLVGILASGPSWIHLPLTAFWFLGYFAFFATGIWLKAKRRERHRPPVLAYGSAAAVAGLLTLVLQPDLIRWAPLFAVPSASASSRARCATSGRCGAGCRRPWARA